MKFLFTAIIGLFAVASAQAGILYDNGGPINDGGNDATEWVQAENFSVGSNSVLTGAGVYIDYQSVGAVWDGTFDYFLFADAGGTPGALLDSGAAQNVTISDSGVLAFSGDRNIDLFEFDFQSVFNATATTTYWLGIHLSGDFVRDNVAFATTAFGSGYESHNGTFDNWFDNGRDHAFFIVGDAAGAVPAPGAALLMGTGLLVLGLRRKTNIA